jgi:hypothetical protein
MARVITPSGDEVRTVYSSAGFAAGDYVFQTASGFEKASGIAPWPIKANATWIGGSVSNLGMGFSSSADILLGPSQAGGIYSGSAITSGSTTLSTKTFSITNSGAVVVRLSSGNWMVGTNRTSTSDPLVTIYDPTFTTIIQTISQNLGINYTYYRIVPDNSGGALFLGGSGQTTYFHYIAETSTNVYAMSGYYSQSGSWNMYANTANLITDGYVSMWGNNGGSGGNSTETKITYTPRVANTPSESTFNTGGGNCTLSSNGGGAVYFDRGVYDSTLLGTKTCAVLYYTAVGTSFVLVYDNGVASTSSASFSFTSYGPGSISESLGRPTFRRSGGAGTAILPLYSSSTSTIRLWQGNINSSGFFTFGFFTGNITNTANTLGGLLHTAIYPISNPLNDDCDLLLTYARVSGTGYANCARIITGALANGVVPTVSAEIVINSNTLTPGITYLPLNYWDTFSNNVLGFSPTSSTVGTVAGVAGAALSSPAPFAYSQGLSPSQTGTCVGVALTAASAGGTAKILVRGTAEVRSTLPNMPGALSFNHANYGTPGGIRGSVAGRTVTFEGIDG